MDGDLSKYQKALTSHTHANIKLYYLFTSCIIHYFHTLLCCVSYSSLLQLSFDGIVFFVLYSCLCVLSAQYYNQSSGFKYNMWE